MEDLTWDGYRCFFTDLWRLNGDRGRGTPSQVDEDEVQVDEDDHRRYDYKDPVI
jgi:hypothetical protein